MENETNFIQNETLIEEPSSVYEYAQKTNTILSVLTFIIIVISLFNYLRITMRKR